MPDIYIIPLHTSALAYLICTLLLFLRRKDGERSRLILAHTCLLSVVNRVLRIVCLNLGIASSSLVSPTMLILAIVMVTIDIIYAIEVISPRLLNFKRTLKVCSPLIISFLIYLTTRLIGIEYTQYGTLIDMFPSANHFDVLFRLSLCVVICLSIFVLFYIPYTRKYNNTNKEWILRYTAIIIFNNISYVVILINSSSITHTLYLYISSFSGLYIAYQELFVRLIDKSDIEIIENATESIRYIENKDENINNAANRSNRTEVHMLFCKLDEYMNEQHAWREPDLSMHLLSQYIGSNRTSLTKAMQDGGYSSFHDYVAYHRIREFCCILNDNRNIKIDELFYQVGFRSRSTAFVHFKKQMSMTPSEYLKTLSETNKLILLNNN